MNIDVQAINDRVASEIPLLEQLRSELNRAVIGQELMISRLLVGLLTGGHVLLEGVPGLAKTTVVNTLAQAMSVEFSRIQFTPDLLPADLLGTMIYVPSEARFETRKGPIFSNLVLADEINRAPSKVQSALLEAMQERQVTIGDTTYPLERPFLVMATQNPIEQEGTYPLPEAQTDRFMLKVSVNYPEPRHERQVLDMALDGAGSAVSAVIRPADIDRMQSLVRDIYVDDKVRDYILSLVTTTRDPATAGLKELTPLIGFGASPRATIFLGQGARAVAFLNGRGYVTPQDVKQIAPEILRHRILLTYEAEAEDVTTDIVVRRILDRVPVP